jgi:hypothetical protein
MFTESNTVEQMILDAATKLGDQPASRMREDAPLYRGESLGDELRPARWTYAPHTDIPRQPRDVMVEPWLREALIRLNPDIAAQPDRADEVIYNLRACILSVQADGLVRANENFMAWLRGEKTMPFGQNGEHVPVRLVDASQPANNRVTVTNQWTFQAGTLEKRFDLVFVVNGLPLVIGEAKTPTRSAVTWFDGAFQINQIYEKEAPAMFVPNVFVRHRGPPVPLRRHPHAHRAVGAVARRRQPRRRPVAARQGHGREHATARCGTRHPAALHPLCH